MLKMLTFKHWTDSAPHADTATSLILTERQFHVEEGETSEYQHDEVRNEKRT